MLEMALWINRRTPPTAGWLDPTRAPEYGVLGPWELGHILQYVARRPAVVDNFGDDVSERGFEQAARYYASEEAAASQLLDALGVRYVIAQRLPPFPGAAPGERSMFASLYYYDGREIEAPEGTAGLGAVPALERHRLVYESSLKLAAAPEAPALYKVFEHVRGATIEGSAAPGARVDASLALRTNRGRELAFATHARADAAGRYALRVPYATSGGPPSVRAAPAYRLDCDGEERPVAVSEAQVQGGARIEAPALCLAAPGAAGSDASGLR
jgi:dolichyl-diphosphooligosaccharide--protein glycosyltransferase